MTQRLPLFRWRPASMVAPVAILAAGVLVQVFALCDTPVRLALNALPFTVVFSLGWLALSLGARRPVRDIALAGLALICVLPALADAPPIPVSTRADPTSGVLWSVALQHPDHAIMRRSVLPRNWRSASVKLRLLIRLERPYRGPADLLVTLNNRPVGELALGSSGGDPYANRETAITGDALTESEVTTIIVRQSVPDPGLRIITFGRTAGTSLGAEGTWFFDGMTWHRGVPHPVSGMLVDGIPNITLEPFENENAP